MWVILENIWEQLFDVGSFFSLYFNKNKTWKKLTNIIHKKETLIKQNIMYINMFTFIKNKQARIKGEIFIKCDIYWH